MANPIVKPEGGNVFTVIDKEGSELRQHVIEMNDRYAFYQNRQNDSEATLSALEIIRQQVLNKGADRSSMAAVESFIENHPLCAMAPLASYTVHPSMTNSKIALEEIDGRQAAIMGGVIVAGVALLWKVYNWIRNWFKNRAPGTGALISTVKTGESIGEKIDSMERDLNKQPGSTVQNMKKERGDKVLDIWNDHYTELAERLVAKPSIFDNFEKLLRSANTYTARLGERIEAIDEFLELVLKMPDDSPRIQDRRKKLGWVQDNEPASEWPELGEFGLSLNRKLKGRMGEDLDKSVVYIQTELKEMEKRKARITRAEIEPYMKKFTREMIVGERALVRCDEMVKDTQDEIVRHGEAFKKLNENVRELIEEVDHKSADTLNDLKIIQTAIRRLTGNMRVISTICMSYEFVVEYSIRFHANTIAQTRNIIISELKEVAVESDKDIQAVTDGIAEQNKKDREAVKRLLEGEGE